MENNIVILDGFTANHGDLSWESLNDFGKVKIYERTPSNLLIERAKEANIILTNKMVFNEEVLAQLPQLKCICVLATGFNNIDILATQKRGIIACNVAGYSPPSVAQHVFALILAMSNQVIAHHNSVQQGKWASSPDWCYSLQTIPEWEGKTMGIYGLGQIGQKVAKIALAFGMKVIAHHKHPIRDAMSGVDFVDTDTLFAQSDVLSLHAPLNKESQGIINITNLKKMKLSAFLINTGRGGLVVEKDLKKALEEQIIAGAGIDVLSSEPPKEGNVLIGVENCIITPHIAWASQASRKRLIEETIKNVQAFLNGKPRNWVNPK